MWILKKTLAFLGGVFRVLIAGLFLSTVIFFFNNPESFGIGDEYTFYPVRCELMPGEYSGSRDFFGSPKCVTAAHYTYVVDVAKNEVRPKGQFASEDSVRIGCNVISVREWSCPFEAVVTGLGIQGSRRQILCTPEQMRIRACQIQQLKFGEFRTFLPMIVVVDGKAVRVGEACVEGRYFVHGMHWMLLRTGVFVGGISLWPVNPETVRSLCLG
ncbi:MAG: hypothetical protein IIA05_10915 [Proteobacteria bacterium]|nr:hypothetical protein [Pseudomonadota bacterium]